MSFVIYREAHQPKGKAPDQKECPMATESPASIVIIGAGPAGLTAAYECAKNNLPAILFEKSGQVGGIARTESYRGFRFDIGGHRFFTRYEEIQRLWEEVLGNDFIKVPRTSRIYYKKRFYKYPLAFSNAIANLGVLEGIFILLSYARAKLFPYDREDNLEQWLTNRFGRRLYRTFFKTYTEKVWGMQCNRIQADWAAQRIKGLSLRSVLYDALMQGSQNGAKTLIREFHYPVFGPGMMWQSMQKRIEQLGGKVIMNSQAIRLHTAADRIHKIVLKEGGKEISLSAGSVVSSVPLDELISLFIPSPPESVIRAAGRLRHRDFILVGLILNESKLFPDNWIYIHGSEVKVGRIQNFKNWSAAMVPDAGKTSLGMEYFCSEGDEIWEMRDEELIHLAKQELQTLGLASSSSVEDGMVFRQPKAYPVYDREYRENIQAVRGFLDTIGNLQTIGRNGLHRYNNQDHSMLTATMAIENILGKNHDIWAANIEPSYFE
jgi:protoporphyrinogen oxidase